MAASRVGAKETRHTRPFRGTRLGFCGTEDLGHSFEGRVVVAVRAKGVGLAFRARHGEDQEFKAVEWTLQLLVQLQKRS